MPAEIQNLSAEGRRAFAEGRYSDARAIYLKAAAESTAAGLPGKAAAYWNNAGGCSIASRHFRDAMEDFRRARQIATRSRSWVALAYTMNNLTSLYLQMLNPEAAASTAREALAGPEGQADRVLTIGFRFQLASALMRLRQFDEALPMFHRAIFDMEETGDLEATAGFWSALGGDSLETGQYEEAETALTEALRLTRIHHLKNSATILRGLAKVKSHGGDARSAAILFDAALAAPPGIASRWVILTDRGQFLLEQGNAPAALRDFRQARQMVATLRADMVPSDQDRVALESGIGSVLAGMVDAGNRVATATGDVPLLAETFDAAEQDRLWSLRALIPAENDWRSHLPERYWEVLARYQGIQRASLALGATGADGGAARLSRQLEEMEREAAGLGQAGHRVDSGALRYAQNFLNDDSILFSFHLGRKNAWVWAVERNRVRAYSLGDSPTIEQEARAFTSAVREGKPSTAQGAALFQRLFGLVHEAQRNHPRWLLEPDASLFEVPFAALVTGGGSRPVYLVEKTSLQLVPGALLLQRGSVPANGLLVGAGDAIYNAADPRYKGTDHPRVTLPRLPNTANELESCAREWGTSQSRLLTGADATESSLRSALAGAPAILHFATHVVPATGNNHSGMIAMSLNASGVLGLLGPKEILARPVSAALVVLNGCHSAQGDALSGSGLMGLTRAWIGAGAGAVLATLWDVPDATAQDLATAFYRALRRAPEAGPAAALRHAQLEILRSKGGDIPTKWAGYFLLGRWI